MDEKNQNVRYDTAYNYASDIIYSTPTFKDFAIAMMDFLGGPEPCILNIYRQLIDEGYPRKVNVEEDLGKYGDIESAMRDWYASFLKAQEKKRKSEEEDIKEDIDELHRRIKKYRSTDKFMEMLRFFTKFHYLAPFNAMIVSWQKPGARFVKSIENWEKMGRRPPPERPRQPRRKNEGLASGDRGPFTQNPGQSRKNVENAEKKRKMTSLKIH